MNFCLLIKSEQENTSLDRKIDGDGLTNSTNYHTAVVNTTQVSETPLQPPSPKHKVSLLLTFIRPIKVWLI